MYGTVGSSRFKTGKRDEFFSNMGEYTHGSGMNGAVGIFVFKSDADEDEIYLVAMAEDKEKYIANAERPETNANYERMAQYFAEEPQWNDGEVVYHQYFK